MPQCAFKNCENNHRNCKVSDGVSFFRFPTNPFRCSDWISIVAKERREEHYKPCKNSAICSIHFEKRHITGNIQRRRLAKTAIPKLQIHVNLNDEQEPISTKLTSSNMVESKFDETTRKTQAVFTSSNSPTASMSDLNTPRKSVETKTKQVTNLQKVNKRLKKNNSSLKNIMNLHNMKHSVDDTIFLDLPKNIETPEVFILGI